MLFPARAKITLARRNSTRSRVDPPHPPHSMLVCAWGVLPLRKKRSFLFAADALNFSTLNVGGAGGQHVSAWSFVGRALFSHTPDPAKDTNSLARQTKRSKTTTTDMAHEKGALHCGQTRKQEISPRWCLHRSLPAIVALKSRCELRRVTSLCR